MRGAPSTASRVPLREEGRRSFSLCKSQTKVALAQTLLGVLTFRNWIFVIGANQGNRNGKHEFELTAEADAGPSIARSPTGERQACPGEVYPSKLPSDRSSLFLLLPHMYRVSCMPGRRGLLQE